MNDVLRDVIGKFVLVYLDEMVVFSYTAEHHKHLTVVLQLRREHKLLPQVHHGLGSAGGCPADTTEAD